MPWLNYRTAWDCELWEWRSYVGFYEALVQQRKEAAANG